MYTTLPVSSGGALLWATTGMAQTTAKTTTIANTETIFFFIFVLQG
jgi:hypothetical protein